MGKEDFDLDKFLGEVEVEAGEEETLRKFFSRDKNKGFVLRQSEFDKKMNAAKVEAQTAAQALADKQATLDDLVTRNIGYKDSAETAVAEFKAKTEKEIKVLKLKAVKAAELAGLELDEIEVDEPTPKARKGAELDLSELDKKYVTGDALNRLATGHVNLTLDLDDIKDVHEDLIGKKMTRKEKENLLAEYNKDIAVAQRDRKPVPALMDTADRLHGYSEKKADLEKGKLAKIVSDAKAAGRAEAEREMAETGLPTPRRAGTGSVLFADKTRKAGDAPVRDRGVKLAMEALEKSRAAA